MQMDGMHKSLARSLATCEPARQTILTYPFYRTPGLISSTCAFMDRLQCIVIIFSCEQLGLLDDLDRHNTLFRNKYI